jgi:hypothetical protein
VNEQAPGTPPALAVSVAMGAAGVVLFLVGAVTGRTALFVAGAGAGALSLIAALYWRSELISAWRRDQRRPPGPGT